MNTCRHVLAAFSAVALLAAGCGEDSTSDSKRESPPKANKSAANLGPVKSYLTDHTEALAQQTGVLADKGQAYYNLVKEDPEREFEVHR
jgi:hypothetical protein